MRSFLLALQFLTIVTIRSDFTADGREMADSRYFYGLVGILLGLALAAAALACWAWCCLPWSWPG